MSGHGAASFVIELVEQDAEAERAGRHLPRPSGAPRLFLSYRWTYDDDDLGSFGPTPRK